ncbi:MAG: hypothetical protein GXO18_01800 [Aquificae bacterium]|nr:hypothetical protein [Aquificota bacterium]
MNKSLKELLLKCEVYLEREDFDSLMETLEEVLKLDFSNLSKEEYEEALKIIEFLIQKAEKKKHDIAEKLFNFQRFKGYIK